MLKIPKSDLPEEEMFEDVEEKKEVEAPTTNISVVVSPSINNTPSCRVGCSIM
nr:hypothetical protein K-LCC10_0327 [Kaumoebavirus]